MRPHCIICFQKPKPSKVLNTLLMFTESYRSLKNRGEDARNKKGFISFKMNYCFLSWYMKEFSLCEI